tara:strand:- start:593 stop:1432 length:840 start_codon:yes stop_codon:yes gene_type:complete
MVFAWFLTSVLILIICIEVLKKYPLHKLISINKGTKNLNWKKIHSIYPINHTYKPQGLVIIGKTMFLASTNDNKPSRIYCINKKSMQVENNFLMPKEATHTSGLTFDGKYIWAVDYLSNMAYCIDKEKSIKKGKADVVKRFATNLKGTSACCIVKQKSKTYLVISDFWNTKKTYFVDIKKAVKDGSTKNAIVLSYQNGGWSQGLAVHKKHLFESENRFPKGIIRKINIEKLFSGKKISQAVESTFFAESYGIEDLAFDGSTIWTTDEREYRFLRCQINR